jgi:transcription factor S
MEFCSCGAIVLGSKGGKKECPSCGCEVVIGKESYVSSKIKNKVKEKEIFNKDDRPEVNPLVHKECPKCKHKKAFYWTKQTRAADEDETQFFKCENCKRQWREY